MKLNQKQQNFILKNKDMLKDIFGARMEELEQDALYSSNDQDLIREKIHKAREYKDYWFQVIDSLIEKALPKPTEKQEKETKKYDGV